MKQEKNHEKSLVERERVALVGAGKGGAALLEVLVATPETEVAAVVDLNPDAPGMMMARNRGIATFGEEFFDQVETRNDLTLIFETTGVSAVAAFLQTHKSAQTLVVPASLARVLFRLVEVQSQAVQERNQMESLYEEKTRYLLRSTHHLKAPFAAIQSYTDVLLGGYAGVIDERACEIVSRIRDRCEMLTTSIREMLELASLRSFSVESLHNQLVSIAEVVQPALDSAAPVARRRGISLDFKNVVDLPLIQCNLKESVALMQILVDNAVNYSHDHSSVSISVERLAENGVRVTVADRGIGIPTEFLERIFDEYFRCNNAAKTHPNGSGLGLAIAKEIAQRNGFKLSVESELGVGSSFYVSF